MADTETVFDRRKLRRKNPIPNDPELIKKAKRFENMLFDLELTHEKFAAFFDLNDRQARRYAAGDAPIPRAIEMVLSYLVRTKTTPESFLKAAGLKLPFPWPKTPAIGAERKQAAAAK